MQTLSKGIQMTEEEYRTLRNLQAKGFALLILSPEELQGVSPEAVERELTTLAWDVINVLKD